MPHLSPSTLTRNEQEVIVLATAGHPRDRSIYSITLGTGLRLAEIVGLNVGDVFAPDGTPRSRVRILIDTSTTNSVIQRLAASRIACPMSSQWLRRARIPRSVAFFNREYFPRN